MDQRHDNSPKSLRINETLPGLAPAEPASTSPEARAPRSASSDHRCHDSTNRMSTPQNHKLVLGRPSSYWLAGGEA